MSVPDDLNLTATSDLSGSGEGSHAERSDPSAVSASTSDQAAPDS